MKNRRQAPNGAPKRNRSATTLREADGRRRLDGRAAGRRPVDAPPRDKRPKNARVSGPAREQRAPRPGPATTPIPRPGRAKSTSQAKARAKARKAKAPKLVRVPLRERLRERLIRLAEVELNPRTLLAKVPFVVLVIAALGLGLAVTLWLSTDAAERSYQLGHARKVNETLLQKKEALERQVLESQAAPALAESARGLGMIPSRDTAHLVLDSGGNWIVVGKPKPAEGVSPPPLNAKLPDEAPPAPPARTAERPVQVDTPPAVVPGAGPEVLVPLNHSPGGPTGAPLGAPAIGPALGPATAAPGLVIVPVPAGVPVPAPVPLGAPAPAPQAAAPVPAPVPDPVPAPIPAPAPAPLAAGPSA